MGISYLPTVPNSMLLGLLRVAERFNVTRSALLQAADVRLEELQRPEGRVERARFEHACECAIALTGDEALGIHWAALMMERGFGPISEGLAHASTLRHALLLLARFEKFFTSEASFEVRESGQIARIVLPSGSNRRLPVRRFLGELSVAWNVKLIKVFCPEADIDAVGFAYEPPRYQDAYTRLFGTEVRFSQASNEVCFASKWLDAPRRATNARDGSSASRAKGDATSCSERLYQVLLARAPMRIGMPEAAHALGIGERSLRRRLTAEGHSFKEIEFRALTEVAKQKLLAEQQTIEETALAMGFSGAGAFHRAFKRWTGQTPSNFQAESRRNARS